MSLKLSKLSFSKSIFFSFSDDSFDDSEEYENDEEYQVFLKDIHSLIAKLDTHKGNKRMKVAFPRSLSESQPILPTSSKVLHIVRELLENERTYVQTLKSGIKNYSGSMDTEILPEQLIGQKFRIFGDIEKVYEFHRDEFLPKLIECKEDIQLISETFTSFIQNDDFYIYVLYGINSKRAGLICKNNTEFFNVSCHGNVL